MTKPETNTSILSKLFHLDGANVLDIGSGDGSMVRFMSEAGAKVIGLECGLEQLAAAQSFELVADEVYMQGVGQDLPFEDCVFDAATFFLSLHHVPEADMLSALQEAARVVKSNGLVYVAEPLAYGSGFEVHAPIDDETHVRQKAVEAMEAINGAELNEIESLSYDTTYHYANFAEYKDQLIRIDPTRRAPFEAMEDRLNALFNRLGKPTAQGIEFDQPMRVNLFRKA